MIITGAKLSGVNIVSPTGTFIGSTASTQIPTLTGFTTVAASPFATGSGNSYSVTAGASVPPYYSITVPGGTGFAMGTGDYTVEWFQYRTDSNSFARIFWYGTSPSLGVSEEGTAYLWPGTTGIGSYGSILNTWVHFALVRISGKVYFYKNGTLISTSGGIVNSTNITDTTSTFYIGSKAASGLASEQYGGRITSFRVCKGLGVYTGNFTVPNAPLGQTASANPYGGINTQAITNQCTLLIQP